jgi:hypothetical protein
MFARVRLCLQSRPVSRPAAPASVLFPKVLRSVTDLLAVRLQTMAQKSSISPREHVTGCVVMRDERDTDAEECLCSPRTLNVNNHETASLGEAGIVSTEQQDGSLLPDVLDHDRKSAKNIRCLQYSKLQPLANFRKNRKPTRYHCAKAPFNGDLMEVWAVG